MQECNTSVTSVYATHDKWHVSTNTLTSLQHVPPTTSGIHARAYYYHDSNVCYPWRVTHMQEYITTMTPIHATYGKWHVCTSNLTSLQCVTPTVSDTYARAQHYVSSICHPCWVTYMQEHTTKPPIRATHDMCAQASYWASNTCHPRHMRTSILLIL